MDQNPIRIILVEDHELVRQSLRQLFRDLQQFEVIADCGNGQDAVDLARRLRPDVMLVDVNMSPMDGFETTRHINEADPAVRVIGLSMNTQPQYAQKMIQNGAMGYLTKSSPFHEILTAIETVHSGEQYICEEIRKKEA
ncbi:MAG: response regulator [Terrimonas sp.]|nr:response regulator [Terrimonas sp.]